MTIEQSSVCSFPQAALHRIFRQAAIALGLPDAVVLTGHVLLRFIPKDAPCPVSPVRVQDLADARGCDPRTIRSHIRRLIAFGLAEDRCLAGGHRTIRRRAGRIVALHGIDFAPLLARGDALAAEATRVELEQEERIRLRAAISALRRRFRLRADGALPETTRLFEALPRRYAHLSLGELVALRDRLVALVAMVEPLEEGSEREAPRPKASEQSETMRRLYFAKDPENPVPPLAAILTALPPIWRSELERGGQRSWSGLIAAAHTRSIALGLPQETWALAVANLGPRRAALLVLAAEMSEIRCPAAWTRALAKRAAEDALDLTPNLIRLFEQRPTHAEAPRSALLPAGPHPTRPDRSSSCSGRVL